MPCLHPPAAKRQEASERHAEQSHPCLRDLLMADTDDAAMVTYAAPEHHAERDAQNDEAKAHGEVQVQVEPSRGPNSMALA